MLIEKKICYSILGITICLVYLITLICFLLIQPIFLQKQPQVINEKEINNSNNSFEFDSFLLPGCSALPSVFLLLHSLLTF